MTFEILGNGSHRGIKVATSFFHWPTGPQHLLYGSFQAPT
jgi:hypothetical protein